MERKGCLDSFKLTLPGSLKQMGTILEKTQSIWNKFGMKYDIKMKLHPSSAENMKFTHHELEKYFMLALKRNRLVALSLADKEKGRYVRIDSLAWTEKPVRGWVKGLEFPVLLHRQIFTNKDEGTGTLYLITNDLYP